MKSGKLKKIISHRKEILSGITNTLLKRHQTMATSRAKICRSDVCGHYDAKGESEKAVLKGKPTCGVCGCSITYLTHSPESQCSLVELGLTPLWDKEN